MHVCICMIIVGPMVGILEKFEMAQVTQGTDTIMNYGYEFVADNNASNRAYLNVNGQSQEFNFTNTAMIKSPALTGDQRQNDRCSSQCNK